MLQAIVRKKDGRVLTYPCTPLRPAIDRKIKSKLTARMRKGGVGEWIELGLLSERVVTNAFVNLLVDALQGISGATINTFKYHDTGTGTTAEAVGNTGLETPCGEARDTGTQIEGASANIYKSVATHTYAGTFDITEHILSNAAAAGTTMDRGVFSAIPVEAGDEVEWSYSLTIVAGG